MLRCGPLSAVVDICILLCMASGTAWPWLAATHSGVSAGLWLPMAPLTETFRLQPPPNVCSLWLAGILAA